MAKPYGLGNHKLSYFQNYKVLEKKTKSYFQNYKVLEKKTKNIYTKVGEYRVCIHQRFSRTFFVFFSKTLSEVVLHSNASEYIGKSG